MTRFPLRYRLLSAFTLVEVMVSMLIFAMCSLGMSGVYIRNAKVSMELRYRAMAQSAALNILEQVRVQNYTTLLGIHDMAVPDPIKVYVADPSAPVVANVPVGYRLVNLNINVRDGTQFNPTSWTEVSIPLETAPSSPKLKMQFWLTLKANVSTTAPVVEVIELALIYQWKNPGTGTTWAAAGTMSGTIHSVVPCPSPRRAP